VLRAWDDAVTPLQPNKVSGSHLGHDLHFHFTPHPCIFPSLYARSRTRNQGFYLGLNPSCYPCPRSCHLHHHPSCRKWIAKWCTCLNPDQTQPPSTLHNHKPINHKRNPLYHHHNHRRSPLLPSNYHVHHPPRLCSFHRRHGSQKVANVGRVAATNEQPNTEPIKEP